MSRIPHTHTHTHTELWNFRCVLSCMAGRIGDSIWRRARSPSGAEYAISATSMWSSVRLRLWPHVPVATWWKRGLRGGAHEARPGRVSQRLVRIISLAASCALAGPGCTQVNSGADAVSARMDAKWVSAIVGMKVETAAGALFGRVRDVVIDGYGGASFATISYGGVMGLGVKYTAVPWPTVAEMLDRDRLLVDRSSLENAPMLPSAKRNPQTRTGAARRRITGTET
jgi:hypothetical protein